MIMPVGFDQHIGIDVEAARHLRHRALEALRGGAVHVQAARQFDQEVDARQVRRGAGRKRCGGRSSSFMHKSMA